ncbi:MAG: antibiotic biosynthesis monooxygenase [Paraglaciecola sp.]|nr:antibiotic biosynthesis monooxygenase [Paraglaciecola sp.]NCT49472.1 antibiotic biosynthesis monooxygenase [Paraglaciecola sp.]
MYGLIGKILCLDGKRDELAHILLKGISAMPGCLSYIVANDPLDAKALWITEVWQNQSMHQASLALPSVQDAIKQGRPMITGFGERFETQPLGGTGL